MSDARYAARGVSAGKEEVHAAIDGIDKGLFPKAFCKVVPDHSVSYTHLTLPTNRDMNVRRSVDTLKPQD